MKGRKFIPLLVVAAGLLAYQNSFTGAFVLDDFGSISENPSIRHLWPIWQCLSPPHRGGRTVEGRPLINLSLAINYALGGFNVWGYHALNLTVHILAGLTLLGIVRRTLHQPALRARFGAAANELAMATAVLWTLHPLQTESVTYVIQRAESIMGLCYLLTLYCFIRGAESPQRRLWCGLCVTACALGMASKEVMVSAPLMVMLYDRTFVSGSFREVWRRRWPLYLALAGTWMLLGFVLPSGQALTTSTIAQYEGLRWWEYLATQPGVILYYLRLSVWPEPLCVCHPWPLAKAWMSVLPPTVVVVILLGASAWAWRTNPVWGFVGAWFFLILAPTSSFIPLLDPICEHRMYLSLAAVVSLVVMGLYSVAGRQSVTVFVVVAIGLGFLTWRRNRDYHSEVTLWVDAVAKFPNDPLEHYRLGMALGKVGRVQEAAGHYEQALRLDPNSAGAHNNLAVILWQTGRTEEARAHWQQALRLRPYDATTLNNYGVALRQAGRIEEAVRCYEEALRMRPDYTDAHYNLAETLEQAGQFEAAAGHYEQVLRFDPENLRVHYSLGVALWQTGRMREATQHWERALRLKPDYAEAHNSLGNALMRLGQVPEAIKHYEQAVRVNADFAEAQNNLGAALVKAGRLKDATEHFQEAVRTRPDYAMAHYNLGSALEQTGRIQEAIGHYEQALRLKPDFVEAQNKLARLRAVQ